MIITEEKAKELYNIFNEFKSKQECYKYLGISPNSNGIKQLNEIALKIGFNLNVYAERRKIKPIRCIECEKEFIPKSKTQKFCCRSCSATFNNRERDKTDQSYKQKLSNSLKKYYLTNPKKIKTTSNICPICGKENCESKGICRHTKKFFENLSYFGLDIKCLGSDKIFDEYERVKIVLDTEYNKNGLSPSKIKKKYNYPKTFENITQILKIIGVKTRNVSESLKNGFINGDVTLPGFDQNKSKRFKHGWHITWDGKKIFYRSGSELKYAEFLDELMIPYEVEGIRVEYFDTEKKCVRIAIPDFILTNTKEIVEIKSRVTFKKQNMIDKFKRYKELGYKPKMLYEGIMYNDDEIKNIEEFEYTL